MDPIQASQPAARQRGSVLFVSLLVMVLLSLLGLAFIGTALTENTVAANWRDQTQAFYAAEAGLESALAALKPLLQAGAPPTDPKLAELSTTARPTLSDTNFGFKELTVKRVRPTPTPYATVLDSGSYKSLNAFTTDYQITAEAFGPRGSRVKLNQVIQYVEIPLFQFAAFYGKGVDLETYAGPEFWVTGRVHANSSIYLADNKANGMHFESYITATGKFYRGHKDEAARRPEGNPDILDAKGQKQYLDFDHEVKNISSDGSTWTASDETYWRDEALNRFGGKLLDSAHGVQEITPPVPELFNNPGNPDAVAHTMIEKGTAGDSAGLKAGKLFYQADLRIVNGVATRKDGSSVSLPGGVITTKSFWDDREKKTMTVTEVDISELRDKLSTMMPSGFNGILYVSQDGDGQAVRLVKGEKLPDGGFTVISENPVYVQGDYNTKNKVPAAVMADAMTVLSSNWEKNESDTKGDQVFENRPAKKTEVNAAFALGPNRESELGYTNGQLNNLIRFLENWEGVDLTYKGSLVALWHSKRAQGDFCHGASCKKDYYSPPNRIWSYDTLFNTNPPPGTPKGIVILKGRWWQE
jgi:Tfp pilus assembly protein PilX